MVSAILLLSYLSTVTTHNAEKKKKRMNTAISLFLVITFAVLPSVSLVAFRSFVCDSDEHLEGGPFNLLRRGLESGVFDYSIYRMGGCDYLAGSGPPNILEASLGALWAHEGGAGGEDLPLHER
tara:strand:+ start:133 stop:504 length:372 start_codon:yes stop_codon:yes gene_type:complete